MNPPKALMSVKSGNVDAVFLPEQWCTMTEEYGYSMLLESKDVWPDLQGSVLLVKQGLIDESPEVVRALARTDARSLDWIKGHKDEAATILSNSLQHASEVNLNLDPALKLPPVLNTLPKLCAVQLTASSFPVPSIRL
jgi:NitT/TauT family transport system substrate-binding protein